MTGPRKAICILAACAALALTACQPTVVLARFPDGSPKMVKVLGEEHLDYDLIGAGDRTCAIIGWCPNWTPPRETAWHQHGYTSCAYGAGGGPVGCRWTPVAWSEWHAFYSGEYYPSDQYSQADHDFLLMAEALSGI